jgi:hypothetical protein
MWISDIEVYNLVDKVVLGCNLAYKIVTYTPKICEQPKNTLILILNDIG